MKTTTDQPKMKTLVNPKDLVIENLIFEDLINALTIGMRELRKSNSLNIRNIQQFEETSVGKTNPIQLQNLQSSKKVKNKKVKLPIKMGIKTENILNFLTGEKKISIPQIAKKTKSSISFVYMVRNKFLD